MDFSGATIIFRQRLRLQRRRPFAFVIRGGLVFCGLLFGGLLVHLGANRHQNIVQFLAAASARVVFAGFVINNLFGSSMAFFNGFFVVVRDFFLHLLAFGLGRRRSLTGYGPQRLLCGPCLHRREPLLLWPFFHLCFVQRAGALDGDVLLFAGALVFGGHVWGYRWHRY